MIATTRVLGDQYICSVEEDRVRILVHDKEEAATIVRYLVQNNINLYELFVSKNDLEELFLQIVSQ